MRIPAFVVLAFVASGCTIHVVETASPVTVAETPPLAPVYVAAPRPVVYERVTPEAAPTPAPTPRVVDRTDSPPPARRPFRTPVKLARPEPRPTQVADLSLRRHRGPMKVKLPEPPTRLTSASVAKAQ
jgi:hypothetical protein